MPNMFGGDQFHPAYDCSTKLGKNQVMRGNTLYTLRKDGRLEYEDVDGSGGFTSMTEDIKAELIKKGNKL